MLNITAFCDASYDTRTKRASSCTILLSDLYFHGIDTRKYYSVESSTQAELLALIHTIELIRELDLNAKVDIYSDGKVVVNEYDRLRKNGSVLNPDRKYYSDWKHLLDVGSELDVTFHYVRAHQWDRNPNKLCDGIANRVLRGMS